MLKYGKPIDAEYSPAKESICADFTRYFGNPAMTKIKDVDSCSVYMAKLNTQLGIEYRYIVAVVKLDTFKPGTAVFLGGMEWLSLQTRTLSDNHDIAVHSYIPQRLKELERKISLVSRDEKSYKYTVEGLPLVVTLLPRSKSLDYASNGTLITALETYSTVISWK